MGKEHTKVPTLYRCRVVLSIVFTEEERSISLGPGSIVGGVEYAELMEKKLASPDMFEVAHAEPQPAEETES